jgi:hypothetical protein
MRRFLAAATLAATVTFAGGLASPAFSAGDPTVDQIYAAARGGHLDQAQQMISQVLADHPQSGQAHYVQAELFAREGKAAQARSELAAAEQLKPGLPFANPRSVQELKAELGLGGGFAAPAVIRTVPAAPRFPWGTLLILVAAVAILLMVFRRRSPPYAQYPAGSVGPGGGPGYGPGYGPAPMGGGIGSGIAGGLASGLAVGAGVVAGEELAHHFLDGGHSGGVIPPAEAGEPGAGNADMGGSDFGVNDPGSGWDDGGGFGGDSGGGGGDWS